MAWVKNTVAGNFKNLLPQQMRQNTYRVAFLAMRFSSKNSYGQNDILQPTEIRFFSEAGKTTYFSLRTNLPGGSRCLRVEDRSSPSTFTFNPRSLKNKLENNNFTSLLIVHA